MLIASLYYLHKLDADISRTLELVDRAISPNCIALAGRRVVVIKVIDETSQSRVEFPFKCPVACARERTGDKALCVLGLKVKLAG